MSQMRMDRPTVPWSLSEAKTSFLAVAIGAGTLVLAWWESSGTGKLSTQAICVVVGVIGLVLIGFGNFFWMSSGWRAVRLRRDELLDRMERAELAVDLGTASLSASATPVVTLAGSNRYHLEGCLLVRGKKVRRLPSGGRSRDDLRPCEMCEPVSEPQASEP